MAYSICIASINREGAMPGHPYPLTAQYYLSELATPQETNIVVAQEDFEGALKELIPSVSPQEMEHYAVVRQRFTQTAS